MRVQRVGEKGQRRGCWPTITGLGKTKEHLFPLSSAPVAPSGSGRTQEPLQQSQFRLGSWDSGVGRRTLACPRVFWAEPLYSSLLMTPFFSRQYNPAVSSLTSEGSGPLNPSLQTQTFS